MDEIICKWKVHANCILKGWYLCYLNWKVCLDEIFIKNKLKHFGNSHDHVYLFGYQISTLSLENVPHNHEKRCQSDIKNVNLLYIENKLVL